MNAAFGWISDLFYWLVRWIPKLFIVQATHKAVKFRHGKKIIPLEPGLHFYWPAVTQVIRLAVVRQTLNLPTQVIQCARGKRLCVSGVVVFEIRDAVAALGRSWDVEDTISDLTLTGILRELVGKPVHEVSEALKEGKLTKELTKVLRRDLRKFGVYVHYCGLTDFAVTQVIHMSGAGGTLVPQEEE
jgi:regulator of protease activity HflC (stomatin/prohibitin superfamily)